MAARKLGSRLDGIGMTASTLCAIHCAVVPVLLTFLPLAGLGFLANPLFEWSMIVLALLLGVSSIFLAYFRTHRRALPLLLLLSGFILVIGGHIYLRGWIEAIIVPVGGLTIAFAHFINFKYVGVCNSTDQFFHLKHNHPKKH
ncbi:MerC domain-containing protein [Mucilaginibacter sp. UR6-11]|uniref:MerC domain-containing protein n=1 Tax=Mucilaginibacter sp. UR6-11 TaxID=1435644 RepID=UPI001E3131FC|nr:MerC domain-containing protein [Mucilaginibacter sp. UR6-11]MCC8424810.1 MerC domain-containing protein [Mucilaginibacter sp. UR6-11]